MKNLLATLAIACLLPAMPAAAAAAAADAALPEIKLSIQKHALTAEVAASDSTRTMGLMHRRMLPENRGMLFVFPQTTPLSFWMMNTHIPLSIAYLDDAGTIINILDMKPLTTDPHPSARPARYALEMNQGWFAKRGIKAGARVEGLDKAPPAQ
jgi:uncharacterized membrane protein (UPF0127 family)